MIPEKGWLVFSIYLIFAVIVIASMISSMNQ